MSLTHANHIFFAKIIKIWLQVFLVSLALSSFAALFFQPGGLSSFFSYYYYLYLNSVISLKATTAKKIFKYLNLRATGSIYTESL